METSAFDVRLKEKKQEFVNALWHDQFKHFTKNIQPSRQNEMLTLGFLSRRLFTFVRVNAYVRYGHFYKMCNICY